MSEEPQSKKRKNVEGDATATSVDAETFEIIPVKNNELRLHSPGHKYVFNMAHVVALDLQPRNKLSVHLSTGVVMTFDVKDPPRAWEYQCFKLETECDTTVDGTVAVSHQNTLDIKHTNGLDVAGNVDVDFARYTSLNVNATIEPGADEDVETNA